MPDFHFSDFSDGACPYNLKSVIKNAVIKSAVIKSAVIKSAVIKSTFF